MLSPRIMLKLLEEAKGVPVLFSVLLPSGNVVLEVSGFLHLLPSFYRCPFLPSFSPRFISFLYIQEFTDAAISLNWKDKPFRMEK